MSNYIKQDQFLRLYVLGHGHGRTHTHTEKEKKKKNKAIRHYFHFRLFIFKGLLKLSK